MTLNQVIKRIQTICTSHQQVRNFYSGLPTDFLTDHTTLYPSVFCQDNDGVITVGQGGLSSLSYRLFFVDLVNVSQDSKTNEVDVQSDMLSVAMDVLAQINRPEWGDWRLGADNRIQLFVEDGTDMYAGVVVDITISFPFRQDVCAIPSDLVYDYTDIVSGENVINKTLYDKEYIGNGTEGNILTLSELSGKKIMLIIRGSGTVIFKVSNLPNSNEYTWNNTDIELGAEVQPNERFLILYRNY